MNRGKLIRKHIGEGLSDLGFVYEKYDGGTWIFEKKLDKFTWYVYIYVYRFDPWQITFHLGTDVSGMVQVHAHQLLDGIWERGDLGGYWAYHDEDSMIKVLEESPQKSVPIMRCIMSCIFIIKNLRKALKKERE